MYLYLRIIIRKRFTYEWMTLYSVEVESTIVALLRESSVIFDQYKMVVIKCDGCDRSRHNGSGDSVHSDQIIGCDRD